MTQEPLHHALQKCVQYRKQHALMHEASCSRSIEGRRAVYSAGVLAELGRVVSVRTDTTVEGQPWSNDELRVLDTLRLASDNSVFNTSMFSRAQGSRLADATSSAPGPGQYDAVHSPECFKSHKKGALATSAAATQRGLQQQAAEGKENAPPKAERQQLRGPGPRGPGLGDGAAAHKMKTELDAMKKEKREWAVERKQLLAEQKMNARAAAKGESAVQQAEDRAREAQSRQREVSAELAECRKALKEGERRAASADREASAAKAGLLKHEARLDQLAADHRASESALAEQHAAELGALQARLDETAALLLDAKQTQESEQSEAAERARRAESELQEKRQGSDQLRASCERLEADVAARTACVEGLESAAEAMRSQVTQLQGQLEVQEAAAAAQQMSLGAEATGLSKLLSSAHEVIEKQRAKVAQLESGHAEGAAAAARHSDEVAELRAQAEAQAKELRAASAAAAADWERQLQSADAAHSEAATAAAEAQQELEARLADAAEAAESQATRVRLLEDEVAAEKSGRAEAESKAAATAEQCEALESETQQLSAQAEEAQGRLDAEMRTAQALTAENAAIADEAALAQTTIQGMEAAKESQKAALEQLREQLQAREGEHEASVEAAAELTAELTAEVAELLAELEERDELLRSTKAAMVQVEKEFAEQAEAVRAKEVAAAAAEGRQAEEDAQALAALRQEKEGMAKQLTALREQEQGHEETWRELTALKVEQTKLDEKHEAVLSNIRGLLAQKQEALSEREAKLKALKSNTQQLKVFCASLQSGCEEVSRPSAASTAVRLVGAKI
eukprot:COSAG04_NODE_282_length_18189_cov_7.893145_2_plen_802_part_00